MTTDADFHPTSSGSAAANPFAGIPPSDFIRDIGALTLLLTSLALPWDHRSVATAHIAVILITLLSIVSLSLTYLHRAGVFPPDVDGRKVSWVRLAANVPYFVLVIAYLVIDAVQSGRGVGFAVALGLAGALLAAQPREVETAGLERGSTLSALWIRFTAGYGIIAIIAGVLGIVFLLTQPPVGLPWVVIAMVVIGWLFILVAFALAFGAIVRRSEVGRVVAFIVGLIVVIVVYVDVFSHGALSGGSVASIREVGYGYGTVFLAGLVGLAVVPPVRVAMNPVSRLQRWFGTVSTLFVVAASIGGVVILLTVLGVTSALSDSDYTGFGIGSIVTLVVYILAAIIARTTLRTDPAGSRSYVLSLAGVMLVLGIIHIVLASLGAQITLIDVVVAFGLPLAIVVLLVIPVDVRKYYATHGRPAAGSTASTEPTASADRPDQPAEDADRPAEGTPTDETLVLTRQLAVDAAADATADSASPAPADSAPPPAPEGTVSGFTAAQALDPATDSQTLYRIALSEPSLRPQLAANPSTYPQLLEWLAQFDDPEIQKALAARNA